MAKLILDSVPEHQGSSYPAPFDRAVAARLRQRLGDAGGLTQFGVNLLRLRPGAWSSQRHWHSGEDEFVYVLSGELTLVTDRGEETLRAGDCAAFPANVQDGHHLVNHGTTTAVCLEVGTRADEDRVGYPDIDLVYDPALGGYARRDGTAYPKKKPSS